MKKTKKAFTLLEVLLAMAILVVVSTMVMDGFMSTLKYSSNSALYARDGAQNSSSAYSTIAEKAGVKDTAQGTPSSIRVAASGTDYDISVNTWAFRDSTNSIYAETNGSCASNRYAVTYTMPNSMKCVDCDTNKYLARDKYDVANNYRWFCTNCGNYIGS